MKNKHERKRTKHKYFVCYCNNLTLIEKIINYIQTNMSTKNEKEELIYNLNKYVKRKWAIWNLTNRGHENVQNQLCKLKEYE